MTRAQVKEHLLVLFWFAFVGATVAYGGSRFTLYDLGLLCCFYPVLLVSFVIVGLTITGGTRALGIVMAFFPFVLLEMLGVLVFSAIPILLIKAGFALFVEWEKGDPWATASGAVLGALLLVAIALLIRGGSRGNRLYPNAGQPWTKEEEQQLIQSFEGGTDLSKIAKKHGRTIGAITARLVRLGKLRVSSGQRPPNT